MSQLDDDIDTPFIDVPLLYLSEQSF